MKAKKLLVKAEKSGQLSSEVKRCIEAATSLEDIETLAAQFKTSGGQQTLANKARTAMPNLEQVADLYLQPGTKLPTGMKDIRLGTCKIKIR